MESVYVLMWTILLFSSPSGLEGESTVSPPAFTTGLALTEALSTALHVAPKSNDEESDPAPRRPFSPQNETSPTSSTAFPPQSEPDAAARTAPSPPPASTHTTGPGHGTETVQASSQTSPSSTSSTSVPPGSTVPSSAASTALDEEHQTPSHPSTLGASETFHTDTTSKTEPTGAAPLENPERDGPSELDVGDEVSPKVPRASPWDPLLAALVSIFIVSTALVSVMLFLRFRQQSQHPEFHRLHDLPMDDLLEDTPLSRHSY